MPLVQHFTHFKEQIFDTYSGSFKDQIVICLVPKSAVQIVGLIQKHAQNQNIHDCCICIG